VARAPQDGYTLYFAPGTMTSVNPYIYKNLPYKPDDFAPISLVSKQAFVLSVRPDFPATTVAQFVEYARSRPAGITMGHVGTGSVTHIVTEWLAERLGIKVQGIPYKGTANSTVDLMGGRLDAQLEGISTGVPMHVSGKYRLIASMGEERANLPAGVQTFREAGYPDLVGYALFGLMAPAGTPAAVIERLGEATRRAVSAPEFVRRLGASGEIAAPSASPAEYAGLLKVESERWGRIIKPMRIQLD
jgi:tripartite-type tricarboxylate transporter receptor subunit TctC